MDVGWHCHASNAGSIRIAEASGFRLRGQYLGYSSNLPAENVGDLGIGQLTGQTVGADEQHVSGECRRAEIVGVRLGHPRAECPGDHVASRVYPSLLGSDHTGGTEKHRGPHGTRIVAGAHCPVVVVPDVDTTGRTGVVVGVDGSEVSHAALAFAAAEAARFAEPLTVVSTWMPVVYTGDIAPYPDMYLTDLQGTTEAFAQSMADEVRKDHPNLEIVVHVDEGDPAAVITEVAASARLAVVGTHGRTGLARFLLGSVSTQVLDHLTTVTAAVR